MKEFTITQTTNINNLVDDLRKIIDGARGRVASTANYELTLMYWHIGERINREVLGMSVLSMENKLCQQCRHNCGQHTELKVSS